MCSVNYLNFNAENKNILRKNSNLWPICETTRLKVLNFRAPNRFTFGNKIVKLRHICYRFHVYCDIVVSKLQLLQEKRSCILDNGLLFHRCLLLPGVIGFSPSLDRFSTLFKRKLKRVLLVTMFSVSSFPQFVKFSHFTKISYL